MAREYQLNSKPRNASGIDYQAELNGQQYAAVSSKPGAALVIAGAGSGKTRTLTYRVAYLLDQGVEACNILLLTFTNKASREMLERVRELLSSELHDLWGGTFHSIGNKMLRRHAEDLGFTRSFSIIDRDDQKALLKAILKETKIGSGEKRFPKAELLLSIFSLLLNTGDKLEDVIADRYSYLEQWVDEIKRLNTLYTKKKQDTNSMDFDDLLTKTLELLKKHEDIRALYQRKFRYILVDEYQDTNAVQCELIDLLVGEQGSLMVVGDDAQSIYSWRGADMENILHFHERYPSAQVFKIETNYRSQPEILELSNAAIRANERQIEKTLRASREGDGVLPALVTVNNPRSQSEFVTQRIQELQDEGIEMEEMAILYRAHYQSMEIQMELVSRGIDFQITSGLRFFEQAHVKDVSAFLRLSTNAQDEVSFKRIVLMLDGVGDVGAQKLWVAWQASGVSRAILSGKVPASFSEELLSFKVPAKAKEQWQQLCYTLDEFVGGEKWNPPAEMVCSVIHGIYEGYSRRSFDNHEHRMQDLERFQVHAQEYEDAEEFLASVSLLSGLDDDDNSRNKEKSGVTLSTIHQAKGLEWKVVFVIWLADGMFPSAKVLESEQSGALEEERRLFYVAVTRAKDLLYMSYPMINQRSFNGDIYQSPSRFLDDFPQELVEEWQVTGW